MLHAVMPRPSRNSD